MNQNECSCGYPISPEDKYCENCGKQVEFIEVKKNVNNYQFSEEIERAKVYFSDPSNKVEDNVTKPNSFDIRLSDGEVIVKTYHCSHLTLQRCDGYLTVTNRRVIFRGKGIGSRIVKEISISSITGLDTFYGTNINYILLLIGLLLILAGFNSLRGIEYNGFLGVLSTLLGFGVGALFIKMSIKRTFKLGIYSSTAHLSPINVGLGSLGLTSLMAAYTLVAAPTHQTDVMMRQLGALIMDIQSRGDFAIEAWADKNENDKAG